MRRKKRTKADRAALAARRERNLAARCEAQLRRAHALPLDEDHIIESRLSPRSDRPGLVHVGTRDYDYDE